MLTNDRRAQAMPAMAALAVAGMFVGVGGWFGIHPGTTDATLVCAAVWLVSRSADAALRFPSSGS